MVAPHNSDLGEILSVPVVLVVLPVMLLISAVVAACSVSGSAEAARW